MQREADQFKMKKHEKEIEESRDKIIELISKVDAYNKKKYPDWYNFTAVTTSYGVPPCIRAMTNYTQHKVKGDSWYSAPFYTGQGGYKLQLVVNTSEDSHVSVAVHLMSGDNDDCLGWPFKGSVDVKLLNWTEDENHLERTFNAHSLDRVPSKGTIGPSPIGTGTVANKKLTPQPDYQIQYLTEDVLCFVISVAEVLSGYQSDHFPSWCHNDLPSDSYGVLPVYRSIATGCNLRKACSSDPFYTCKGGYKVALCVDPRSSKRKVDIGLCLMKGPNDNDLQFPMTGIFTVQLLNWKRDDQHKGLPIEFDDNTPLKCRERVTVGERGECWGECQFISHDELKYSTSEQYRSASYDGDMMCFKISYKPLPQIDGAAMPTWYKHDAHSPTLPCIRTFDNFSIYKETNATWRSQPFYTGVRNGYKLQLKVYANGDGADTGTHLSLYIYLMKGEHDNKLSWPFNDNITVQLLNWHSDKGHKERTIRFHIAPLRNCQRVSGAPSGGFGCGQFISHTELLDCSTNVRYVDNSNRICFRIIGADADIIDWF